jgi:hypothetical protein
VFHNRGCQGPGDLSNLAEGNRESIPVYTVIGETDLMSEIICHLEFILMIKLRERVECFFTEFIKVEP